MKYICSLLGVLVIFSHLTSQNLVPNPNFEDTLGCPTSWSEIAKAKHWNNCGSSTPDFYYGCQGAGNFMGVPYNWLGYQQALSGKGYAGLVCYNSYVPHDREIIIAKLTTPLVKGQTYFLKFSVNRADDSTSNNTFVATDKIGMRFRNSPCPSIHTNFPPDNFAHLVSNTIIVNTTTWTTVSGSFTADSSYKYVLIGNFFTNTNTSITPTNVAGFYTSYYYVDDICVSLNPNKCNDLVSISEIVDNNLISIYPNPCLDNISVNCVETIDRLVVTSVDGTILKIYDEIDSSVFNVDMTLIDSGVYFFRFTCGHRTCIRRIFKQ